MEDIQTIIILLSIIIGLLSVIIVALLAVVITLLAKLNVDKITTNVASATEWLSPTKVFSEIAGLFRKK